MSYSRARVLRGLGVPDDQKQHELVIRSDQYRIREILADRLGRTIPTGGNARLGPNVGETNPLDQDLRDFLRKVVGFLDAHRLAGDLREIIVFADPEMLGLLQQRWSTPLKGLVVCEIPVNVVDSSTTEIEARATRHLEDRGGGR